MSWEQKIQAMKKVSDADKTTLAGQIQTQVTTLTTLKAKIDADTDITVLRTDVKSIIASYRIFMLIIPRGHIVAAADRMSTLVDDMTALGTKIEKRITAAQTAGKDVTALNALLADFTAKLADAKTQSQAAITKVVSLNPDNGDTAVMQANTATLKAARADIKVGTQDLSQCARRCAEDSRRAEGVPSCNDSYKHTPGDSVVSIYSVQRKSRNQQLRLLYCFACLPKLR